MNSPTASITAGRSGGSRRRQHLDSTQHYTRVTARELRGAAKQTAHLRQRH